MNSSTTSPLYHHKDETSTGHSTQTIENCGIHCDSISFQSILKRITTMHASILICLVLGLFCSAAQFKSALLPDCPAVDPEFPVFFPDPENCRRYYECSNGDPIHMRCAPPLVWDQTLLTCVVNDPDDPICDLCPEKDPAFPDYPTFFPDPHDCRRYYECSNGEPIHMSCAQGLVWDQEQLTCVVDNPMDPICGRQ